VQVQTTLPIGSLIQKRYYVESLLGKGGFGAVYLVKDQRVRGNLFALKEVVDPSKKERDRFTFECDVLRRLDHPSLPRVYRAFEDDKNIRAYMLMDYIEGPNLEQLRLEQPEKRFPLSQTLKIMAPIVDAIAYLHSQHPPIIHRDIKPANIIVPEGGGDAVLVDFGIAKEYEQDSTTTAIRRCSPGYGAPEQYAWGTNLRTDVYGLGATFYVLLTGLVPADSFYRMTQLGSKNVDPLEPVTQLAPEIPASVGEAIQRALAVNSNERFGSVDEFWQALTAEPIEDAPTVPALVPGAQGVTVGRVATAPTAVVYKRNPVGGMRGGRMALLGVALVLLALLFGSIFGAGLLTSVFHPGRPVHSAAPGPHHTPTAAVTRTVATPVPTVTQSAATTQPTTRPTTVPTARPTTTPTPQPTMTPTPTLTPSPDPKLVGSYSGNISDQYTDPPTNTTMSLTQVSQNGTNISGTMTLGPALQGSGSFTGSVSAGNAIQFLVAGAYGHLPLFFQGQIQSDGSMSGSYCSYQNGHCDRSAGGYGTWSVSPSSSSASSAPTQQSDVRETLP
jgi:predicted Ser/Thr protein kinase